MWIFYTIYKNITSHDAFGSIWIKLVNRTVLPSVAQTYSAVQNVIRYRIYLSQNLTLPTFRIIVRAFKMLISVFEAKVRKLNWVSE